MDPTTLAALGDFPRQLEAHYAAIPAQFKHWRPTSWEGVPGERLSAIEQICHVKDIEIDGYHLRFRRTLEETDPELVSLDGEALAAERAYAGADASQVFAAFREARAQTIQMISGLTAAQLKRSARFEGRRLTLRSLVHYLCSHDQQHLAGLQWLSALIAAPHPVAGN